MDDLESLTSAIRRKLDEEPAEIAFKDALAAAIREVHDVGPRALEVDPASVLKQELHDEAEGIRGFLAKVDRRRKLETVAEQIIDSFGHQPDFRRSDLPQELENIKQMAKQLREETESDSEARAALGRISRLEVLIDNFERSRKPNP